MTIWFNKGLSTVYTLVNALKQELNVGTYIIVSHTHREAVALVAADESFLEPAGLVGVDYGDWALQTCRERSVDILFAGKEMGVLMDRAPEFQALGTKIVGVADSRTLQLLENKASFLSALPPGVASPRWHLVHNLAEFEAAYADLAPGPVCFKPAEGIYGLGFRRIRPEDEKLAWTMSGEAWISLEHTRKLLANSEPFTPLLVMRYLEGPEYSVDVLAQEGELAAAVVRRKQGSVQHLEDQPGLVESARQITSHFGLSGIFNIQFKAEAGVAKILELNPRPSGGIGVAMCSGINFPYWAVLLATGAARCSDVPAPRLGSWVAQINQPVVVGAPL